MAKTKIDAAAQSRSIIEEIQNGIYHPVYLLMGEEAYYPDLVSQTIIDNCIDDEFGKDFNETICYGMDVNVEDVITQAREYPMMSERRLIVIRDAQLMEGLEKLEAYCSRPLDSTVLVILLRKATIDKRTSFYKSLKNNAVVLESPALRDYEMPSWISSYFRSQGVSIEEPAVALLAEYVGTDLSTVVNVASKMLKNLAPGSSMISVRDVERNVGLSRSFSVFELTKALSMHDAATAFRIAGNLGSAARFNMPQTVSALFLHFSRILKYGVLLSSQRQPSPEDKARALAGVSPYFYREYDTAVRYYPPAKATLIISLLCEYDYLGKGGDGVAVSPGELLIELVAKILNI